MPTAAIYTRLSQDRDGTKTGTERQEADCRALCDREALTVARVFTDDDRSAYNGAARPAFEEMIASLDGFDALVFWKVDRLVRRTLQFWRVVEACDKADVRLVSVCDPLDTSSPLGQGIAGMVASMGEQESKNTSLRVTRQRQEAALAGRPHGGPRPFGYEPDGTTLRPAEAAVVREMVDRVLAGEPLRAIARDLNGRGERSPRGSEWSVQALKTMVTGPRVAALRVHKGVVIGDACWPAIITVDDHHRVRAILGNPRLHRRGRPPTSLLSGLLRCGRCGARMHAAAPRAKPSNRHRRRYICPSGPGPSGGCGRVGIAADPVEAIVTDAVLAVLDTSALARASAPAPERAGPADALAKIDARLADLADMFAAGEVTRAEWQRARAGLDERRERAARVVSEQVESAALRPYTGRKGALRAAWPDLSLEGRRAILGAVIESIPIGPSTKRGQFDPERIGDPVWRA